MKQNLKKYPLKEYLIKQNKRYQDLTEKLTLQVFGVSNTEGVTETQHKRSDDLSKYLLIKEGFFAYNPYRINVGSIGLVEEGQQGLVSPAYVVFRTDENKLLPELLLDFLKSKEGLEQINKYARGTVRKALRFEDLEKIEMPIPDIAVQKKILEQKRSFDKKASKFIDTNTIQRDTIQDIYKQILQDAITGKLSEEWRKENKNIESAEVLLEKIKKDKEKLIKEGKIKKQKALPPITEEDIPFGIPDGWVWCRLEEITNINPRNYIPDTTKVSFIPMRLIEDGYISSYSYEERYWREVKKGFTHFQENDLLVSKITPCFENRKSVIAKGLLSKHGAGTTELHVVRVLNKNYIDMRYLLWLVKTEKFIQDGVATFSGTAGQQRVGKTFIENYLVPLPPLSEQNYIVERIESLFTKLDKIKELNTENKNNIDLLNQVVLKEIFESNND